MPLIFIQERAIKMLIMRKLIKVSRKLPTDGGCGAYAVSPSSPAFNEDINGIEILSRPGARLREKIIVRGKKRIAADLGR